MRQAYAVDRLCQRIRFCSPGGTLPPCTLAPATATKRAGEHIMFDWLISLLIVVVLLIKILDYHGDRANRLLEQFPARILRAGKA